MSASGEVGTSGGAGRDGRSRNVTALLATTGLMYTGWDLITPFVPLLVLELEGGDPRAAAGWSGLVVGIAPLLSALSGPFWGAFAERYGAQASLLRTIATSAVLVTVTVFVWNIWQLLVLRALVGLLGGFYVLIHNLAAKATSRERVGQTIGLLQAIQLGCLALVPPAAGLVIDRWGLRSSFLLAAAVMVVAFGVMWSGYRAEPTAAPTEGPTEGAADRKGRSSFWSLLAGRELALVALIVFCGQFVERVFNALVPLLVVELEPHSDRVGFLTGLVLGLGSGATALASLGMGRLSRRVPARRLLLGSLLCGVLILPLLAMAGTTWQLVALRVALGLLAGGTVTLAYAYVSTFLPADRMGASFSMFASCAMLGASVGPMTLGPVAAVSLRLPLVIGAVAFGVCLLLLLLLPRPQGRRAPE